MKTENLNAGPYIIRTASGTYLNVLLPNLDLIDINDIITGLQRTCRFSGHTSVFYSVLEHSVDVCVRASKYTDCKNSLLMCLLHDAAEAYIGDVPSPVKKHLPDYCEIETHLLNKIYLRFGVDPNAETLVKHYDREALKWEWNNLVLKRPFLRRLFGPVYRWNAKRKFIKLFNELSK